VNTVEDIGSKLAEQGLSIGAIKLDPDDPFQWASGYRMPVYNDNRMFLFDPESRKMIARGLALIIEQENITIDVVAGTATAGIPHGTSLADLLDLPYIYIRDKPKGHGLRNRIEGIDAGSDLAGREVIVIEDLISTGGSSAKAVEAVRVASGTCGWCVSIFNYGLDRASEQFANLDPPCEVRSLLTFDVLLETARVSGRLTTDQIALLDEWRMDPFSWGDQHGFPRIEK